MSDELKAFLRRLIEAAPVFPDPDDILEDTAMEIDVTWRDIAAARQALGVLR